MGRSLEDLYKRLNKRAYIHPDPLEAVYWYANDRDREIAGLVAASLAFGRAALILDGVRAALGPMGESPCDYLLQTPPRRIRRAYSDFRYRYVTGTQLSALFCGIRALLLRHGSLEGAFKSDSAPHETTVRPALTAFVRRLVDAGGIGPNYLLPDPRKDSACKRLYLYLRWMVRQDMVDPGGWRTVSPSRLVIPVDTHMHRIALALGLTRRKQAGIATALEITEAFRAIRPEDPLRYDFSLTRLGIHPDEDPATFLAEIDGEAATPGKKNEAL